MEKINWTNYRQPCNYVSEALRTIRANLLYIAQVKGLKMFEVTSPVYADSKSSVSADLAIVMAQIGRKVLLIDANFSNPVHHVLFGLQNVGITDCISTGEAIQNKIQHCSEQDNLDIITVGSTVPSSVEILECEQMRKLLAAAKEEYDFVFLDVRSVQTSADAVTACQMVDGVLIVLRSGEDKLNELREAKKVLEKAGANIIGCILSNK